MNNVSAIESSRLTATYLPIGDLTPDPRNARTHPKSQIDQIRASIEAFGFTNPIPVAARLMGLSLRPAAQGNRRRHCRLTNFHAGQ
jgi:ParB-like chromosome segregation protein Spo0J